MSVCIHKVLFLEFMMRSVRAFEIERYFKCGELYNKTFVINLKTVFPHFTMMRGSVTNRVEEFGFSKTNLDIHLSQIFGSSIASDKYYLDLDTIFGWQMGKFRLL